MSLAAHLAVQRNPFSTATGTAKVCDGAVPLLCGERSLFSFTIPVVKGLATLVLTHAYSCLLIHVTTYDKDIVGTASKPPDALGICTLIKSSVMPLDYSTTYLKSLDEGGMSWWLKFYLWRKTGKVNFYLWG
jgi:hypothetical protein